jgi:hypothetical protein
MKRIAVGMLVVLGLVAVASGTSSAASPGQVSHFRSHGSAAEAAWARVVGTDFVGVYVQASTSKQGGELNVEQFHDRYNAQGQFLGSTVAHAAVSSGYLFTIDKARLDVATVNATGVPATLCRFDANWNPVGTCSHTALDVWAAWTGQGLITRAVKNDHYRYHGFSLTEHSNGSERNATATAIVNGIDLTSDFLFAGLTTNNYGSTTICLHSAC